jgi:hypothetical protein
LAGLNFDLMSAPRLPQPTRSRLLALVHLGVGLLQSVLFPERQPRRLEALLGLVEIRRAAERRAGDVDLDVPRQTPGLRSLAKRMRPMRWPSSSTL